MKRAQPGWLVLTLAAVAAAIGSSLPFYTFGPNVELTVWSRSLFPTATLIPAFVVLIGLEALFVLVMGHEPRSPFLNFTWSQARLAGSSFAILLALSFLVQGRAGGDLGSGYLVLSLSTLATFGGAVLTRRAELVRGREEIVTAEHPWRAAALRWRRELTAKVEAYAAGTNRGPQRVQPAPGSPDGEKEDERPQEEKPAAKAEEPVPKPAPVPRLSAVRTGGEADARSTPTMPTRKPVTRPPKTKAAAKKTTPTEREVEEPKTEEPKTEEAKTRKAKTRKAKTRRAKPQEPKPQEPKPQEPKPQELKTAEVETPEPTAEEQRTAEIETAEPTAEEQKTAEVETPEVETAAPTAEVQEPEAPKDADSSDTPLAEDGDAETEPASTVTGDAAREHPAAEG
jgi:hypothetical protein